MITMTKYGWKAVPADLRHAHREQEHSYSRAKVASALMLRYSPHYTVKPDASEKNRARIARLNAIVDRINASVDVQVDAFMNKHA